MKRTVKIIFVAIVSLTIVVAPFSDIGVLLFKARAQSISYGSWSGWSSWQDAYASEIYEGGEKIREVQSDPNVIASTNYKTVYNYYRYANQYTGGYGSYAQSSSYPYRYSYTFDSELPYIDSTGGGRYKYWYSSSNYISVYASSPYTTQEVVSYNYKTQYRYRTRTATYSYTVSYNANGGSGAPSSQTKTKVVSVSGTTNNTLTLSNSKPTKTYTLSYNANGGTVSQSTKQVSCTFVNWKASNGILYEPGNAYNYNEDTTMTAQWRDSTAGTLETPTWEGHTFDGWYTDASGGTQITSSTTISKSQTIYAHWSLDTYQVQYDANGGNGAPSSQTKEYGTDLVISDTVPTKEFYITYNANGGICSQIGKTVYSEFDSWNTQPNGSGTSYTACGSYTKNEGVILYAQWYDAKAGDLALPTKTNYKFDGWFTQSEGGSLVSSDTIITDDVELFAHWTLNAYDVFYDANGGYGAPNSQKKIHDEPLQITYDEPVTPKTYWIRWDLNDGNLPQYTVVNCTFYGWNTKADGSGITYKKTDVYTDNASILLYALWQDPLFPYFPTPVRTGYTFIKWTELKNGSVYDIDSQSYVNNDMVVKAVWEANQYNIEFNANGGKTPTLSKSVHYDDMYGDLPEPTKSGHTFDGWYTSETEGTKIESSSVVQIAEDQILYAHWQAKAISSISVDFDGTKTDYYVGDTFDLSDVKVICVYSDGESALVSDGFTCSSVTLNKVSVKRVKVTYLGKETYFNINVTMPPIQSISIKIMPNKTSYKVGETLDSTGLLLSAIYTNGLTGIIDSGYTTQYDFSTTGTKTVKVTCDTASTAFNVTVTAAPTITLGSVTVLVGQSITLPIRITQNSGFMGLKLTVSYDPAVFTLFAVTGGDLAADGMISDSLGASGPGAVDIVYTGSEDVTANGVLAYLHFEVNPSFIGTKTISLGYVEADTFNSSWDSVYFHCQNSTVKIEAVTVPHFYGARTEVEPGSTVTVPIRAENLAGVRSFSLNIDYTAEGLALANVKSKVNSGKLSTDTSTAGIVKLNWQGSDNVADGIIAELTFNVSSSFVGGLLTLNCTALNINGLTSTNAMCSNISLDYSDPAQKPSTIYCAEIVGAKPGSTVSMPVYIKNNHGMMGFKMLVEFDSTLLEAKRVTNGTVLTSGTLADNVGVSPGCFTVVWNNTDDVNGNGLLYTISFTVKSGASFTSIPVMITYDQNDTYDSNWNDVKLSIDSFSIGRISTVRFDANGGSCDTSTRDVVYNDSYGDMPTATREGYTFNGWYTAASGGAKVTADMIVETSSDQTLYAQWIADRPVIIPGTGIVINENTHFIYGLPVGYVSTISDLVELGYITISGGTFEYEFSNPKGTLGTGTTVKVLDCDHQLVDSYTIIIFGDVDGDGWYNGMDAFIVSLISAGLLTEENLGTASWMAADVNHDGVIDETDVDLLTGAGLLLNKIDQTKAPIELAENADYIEYAKLIDQSAGVEFIPETNNKTELSTSPNTNETVEKDKNVDEIGIEVIITNIFDFIKKILSMIFSFVIK